MSCCSVSSLLLFSNTSELVGRTSERPTAPYAKHASEVDRALRDYNDHEEGRTMCILVSELQLHLALLMPVPTVME